MNCHISLGVWPLYGEPMVENVPAHGPQSVVLFVCGFYWDSHDVLETSLQAVSVAVVGSRQLLPFEKSPASDQLNVDGLGYHLLRFTL